MFFTDQEFRQLAHPAGLDSCPRCGGCVARRDLGLRPPGSGYSPPRFDPTLGPCRLHTMPYPPRRTGVTHGASSDDHLGSRPG